MKTFEVHYIPDLTVASDGYDANVQLGSSVAQVALIEAADEDGAVKKFSKDHDPSELHAVVDITDALEPSE